MYEFEYQNPTSADAALAAHQNADDGLFLAGGQTIITVMKQRLAMPSDVIDLNGIGELQGISAGEGNVIIGAMTTHAEVAASDDVCRLIPALADLLYFCLFRAQLCGHFSVLTRYRLQGRLRVMTLLLQLL